MATLTSSSLPHPPHRTRRQPSTLPISNSRRLAELTVGSSSQRLPELTVRPAVESTHRLDRSAGPTATLLDEGVEFFLKYFVCSNVECCKKNVECSITYLEMLIYFLKGIKNVECIF
jgi:hypothetical protein